MALRRHLPRPPRGKERQALAQELMSAGHRFDAACGTCGGNVRADDPKAVQTWRAGPQVSPYLQAKEPGWRFHGGVCDLIRRTLPPERDRLALAAMLDPDAHPVTVDQAVTQVAAELGGPLLYCEVPGTAHTDRARGAWRHVGRTDFQELAQAVSAARGELAATTSRLACALCGVWPIPAGPTCNYKGHRACPDCSRAVTSARKKVGGLTSNLDVYGMAAAALPEGVMFAEEVVPAVRHGSWAPMQEPRAPWGHLRRQPIPKTAEERLAELEARLAGAAP